MIYSKLLMLPCYWLPIQTIVEWLMSTTRTCQSDLPWPVVLRDITLLDMKSDIFLEQGMMSKMLVGHLIDMAMVIGSSPEHTTMMGDIEQSWRNITHCTFLIPSLLPSSLCFRYTAKGFANKINYYSNPDISFMGMTTGESTEADNARLITEHRFDQADKGDESGKCSKHHNYIIGHQFCQTHQFGKILSMNNTYSIFSAN